MAIQIEWDWSFRQNLNRRPQIKFYESYRKKRAEPEQRAQDETYRFPYHYIPQWDRRFSQIRNISWGYRYAGGIKVVLDLLKTIQFNSLVDVGCGEGRFLHELSQIYPDCRLLGIDHTDRPIQLARALNPDLRFITQDITLSETIEKYDVVTLIEVLEHIPPESCSDFVSGIRRLLTTQGFLILTVPHLNEPETNRKHYRHFDSELRYR